MKKHNVFSLEFQQAQAISSHTKPLSRCDYGSSIMSKLVLLKKQLTNSVETDVNITIFLQQVMSTIKDRWQKKCFAR